MSADPSPSGRRPLVWLNSPLLARLLHPRLEQQPTLERVRARLLAVTGLLLTLAGPLVALGYFRNGEHTYGAMFLGFSVLGLGTFLAIRLAGSPRLSSHLGSAALLMATLTGTYALGGANSLAARWFALVPVLAAVFGGLRAGLLWATLSWLSYIGLVLAPGLGVTFPAPSQVADDTMHQIITMTTFMGVTLAMFVISELLRVWLTREQLETQRRLQVALDEAIAAGQTKDRFLAMMSHELRTPLNAIIGYAELLVEEMEHDGHDLYIEDAQAIRTSGRHLLTLISDILDLTLIESGRLALHLEDCSPGELVHQLEQTTRPLARTQHNALVVELDDAIADAPLYTDPSKLRQVLLNLLTNAAKFTEHGTITLRALPGEELPLRFEVEDDGAGMSEELQARVWQDFVQGDESTTRRHGGVGLGLALVRRIVHLLGGTIALESAPGEGSTFTVELPLTLDDDQRLATSSIL